jgi:hypothetical protein
MNVACKSPELRDKGASLSQNNPDLAEIKGLLEAMVRAIVDQPERVSVREIEGTQATILELSVAAEDIGKVIGKRGIHADAIRRIVHAIGGKHKKRYLLEILEQSGIVAPTAADS